MHSERAAHASRHRDVRLLTQRDGLRPPPPRPELDIAERSDTASRQHDVHLLTLRDGLRLDDDDVSRDWPTSGYLIVHNSSVVERRAISQGQEADVTLSARCVAWFCDGELRSRGVDVGHLSRLRDGRHVV